MSSLGERLRGIVQPARSRGHSEVDADRHSSAAAIPSPEPRIPNPGAADVLEGEWREAGRHRFLVVDRSYAPGHRHGSISVADSLPPEEGWPRLHLLGGSPCGRRPLFMDLETTGLAGGAGSYAFLIGCAWFDRGRFHIRQFFLSSFPSEPALLEAVRTLAEGAGTVVTYNGKSFDLPLIETRYALNRLPTPFGDMPHVDLLHPARRLWRGHDDSHRDSARVDGAAWASSGCRLSTMEQLLLGHERLHDVPGFEIPARYFRYVHSGDAAPLAAVFEHNRLDLLSLAFLTARAAQLLEQGASGALTAREALGLGVLYERSGMTGEALACFARAADMGGSVRAEALRAFALISRRLRRYEDAAAAWQRLLDMPDCPPMFEREAAEALAVHHEHRLRNPRSARGLALRSLRLDGGPARRKAAEHRLARLDRKLGNTAPAPALF